MVLLGLFQVPATFQKPMTVESFMLSNFSLRHQETPTLANTVLVRHFMWAWIFSCSGPSCHKGCTHRLTWNIKQAKKSATTQGNNFFNCLLPITLQSKVVKSKISPILVPWESYFAITFLEKKNGSSFLYQWSLATRQLTLFEFHFPSCKLHNCQVCCYAWWLCSSPRKKNGQLVLFVVGKNPKALAVPS